MTTLFYEKPEALRDLSTERHGIIAASAGTGKTYTLQHLVVEILLEAEGARLDEILLVTFTVAATSDLKAKIRKTLEKLIEGWELARSRELEFAELVDEDIRQYDRELESDDHWSIDLDGVNQLRQALRNFDRAPIYTIHGFCQRILVEHAFQNRRLFEQEHVSEDDVIEEAFAEMLRRDARPESEVEDWIRAYLGSGDSIENLRDALAGFIKCTGDYRPKFNADLFADAVARFVDAVEATGFEAWQECLSGNSRTLGAMATNHGPTLYENLRDHRDLSLPELVSRLDKDCKKATKYFRGKSPQKVLTQNHPINAAIDELLENQISLDVAVVNILGKKLEGRVDELKSRNGYFTFADMVRVVRDTLIDGDEEGHLLASIRSNYRFGLIDEFQDTDRAQWEIFETIFVDDSNDGDRRLYLVGDPKQAIYGFRGGDVYTYLDACDRLENLGPERTSRTSLDRNFRSTPAVLNICNAIFQSPNIDLGDRIKYEKSGVKSGKPWLNLQNDEQNSEIGLISLELSTEREKVKSGAIRNGIAEQYAREISDIVEGRELLKFPDGPQSDSADSTQVGPEHIYILCRRRADLDTMADALRRHGVDFAFLKKPGLFKTQEARDVYDLLLALDDPYDRSRRARAWMTPFFDLTLSDLKNIADIDESARIFEKLLRWSRLARQTDFARLFDAILRDSGAIRRRILLSRGERELTNYLHLFELLADDGGRHVRSIADLAARLKGFIDERIAPDGADTDQQRIETEDKAVQLLTIHASKGLQRGVVFVIPRLSRLNHRKPLRFHDQTGHSEHRRVEWHDSKKRMPADQADQYEEELIAEELRLAYVALTRAELLIYVPSAEEDSPIYKKIKGDPFIDIIDRIHAIGDDHEAARHIEVRRRTIDVEEIRPDTDQVRTSLEDFSVDTALISAPADEEAFLKKRRELMLRRWEVTSYSKLKQRGRTSHSEDEKSDDDAPTGVLPGGMATGNFLHLVLEDIDYELVDQYELQEWLDDEDLHQFFVDRARRYGRFEPGAIDRAKEIVYDTLKAPVELAGDTTIDGVRRLDPRRVRREVEFLFPVAEPDDDRDAWRRHFLSGAEVRGGFATGIVDLLFEYDGRLYFADWKSDRAHPFDDTAIADLIESRYATQANLYSLALCRMLGIDTEAEYDEHFGGYFYFFVRGMRPDEPGRGIFGDKVDWPTLRAYERRLLGAVRDAKVAEARLPGANPDWVI